MAAIMGLVAPVTGHEGLAKQETAEARDSRHPPRSAATSGHRHRHKHGRRQQDADRHTHSHKQESRGATHRDGDRRHKHQGVDTEHLFGFTIGSDIDAPGAGHFIADLSGRFGKRPGSYTALSQHFEYGFAPWADFHVGLGASFARHDIFTIEGLDDRRRSAFEGFSIDLRQRLLDRAQSPFGLTFKVEPHWARLDEVSGEAARKLAVEFTLAADRELIKDRLFGALNVLYEPEWVRLKGTGETERESTIALSLAAMTPLAPAFFIGAEARYLRSYEGAALEKFAGEAVFAGPILFANVGKSVALVAAYSTQVAGRAAGGSGRLDLENFERHRGKLKAVIHF
jgi:hypothetical protein